MNSPSQAMSLAMRSSVQIPLFTLTGSVVAATLFLWGNGWNGAGDLTGMFLWTLPLAFAVSPSLERASLRLLWATTLRRALLLSATGAAAGLVWTMIVYVILRKELFAFSFPVLYCWIFGGICGGLSATNAASRS